ncbi:MAG: branched-chain amino acid transporter permease [Frankiales bacterium]|nr:branched-chain amino acid transporter permease [Frankiales bacterium]
MGQYGFTLVSGLTAGSTYALAGAAFGLVFFVTGRFHFAFGVWYGLAGMFAAWAVTVPHWSKGPAIVVALLLGIAGGMATELIVYRTLDRRAGGLSLLGVFIASLGLVIGGEAIMGLVFKQAASFNISLVPVNVYHWATVPVPLISLTVFLVCWVMLVVLYFALNKTSLGRQMRAVEANSSLAADYGINTKRIILIVFFIVSAIGGVLGILQAGAYAATPVMGENVIIYAIVVAFLGRNRSIITIGLIGEALGLIEAFVGFKFGQLLQSLVIFVVLFVFIAGISYAPAIQAFRLRRSATA